MFPKLIILSFFILYNLNAFAQERLATWSDNTTCNLNVDVGNMNEMSSEIIYEKGSPKIKLLRLRDSSAERVDEVDTDRPDIFFGIKAPLRGEYVFETTVVRENLDSFTGNPPTLFAKIQVDNQRPTRRIVSDARNYYHHDLGKFHLSGEKQQLKIWLPKGVCLEKVVIKKYVPPIVPADVKNYTPSITPPEGHPRLWVTPQTLPLIKKRLEHAENAEAWQKIEKVARHTFHFVPPRHEILHYPELEEAVQAKAFFYLVLNDSVIGREAVRLTLDYLSVLEFGNIRFGDITRNIGSTIYTASLVYDWCYAILSEAERHVLYSHLMRLAGEMEIGWPPFKASVINGHGNEAQVNRDLLAMSIAVYDEDPVPYRYTSYQVLEQLVPMRKFEYQSPRHNQGVDYGAYRLGWEMHAAWLFYRMTGRRVFDNSITDLSKYWLYMRLPDGEMLRDGDMFSVSRNGNPYYWKHPETMLLLYSYANDPLTKAEFYRQGGIPDNPLLFLLINDPNLEANPDRSSLPLTIDFGSVLGSMVARTGWDMGMNSNDVVAEIKGGGYHFGNHQHSDAGAIQIYYKGLQVCDLGLYSYYGSSYDFSFNKRSIAHSMMLVKDPDEEILFNAKFNDGGTRFNQRFPLTPQEVKSDPWFNNGEVLSADFGPSKQKPLYSFFKVDLTKAYSEKMSRYTRSFCFLNLNRDDIPAAIILADDVLAAKSGFKKEWQINTLTKPTNVDSCIILQNSRNGSEGKTYVQMLQPEPAKRQTQILGSADLGKLYGPQVTVSSNIPEANGYHVLISPTKKSRHNKFLTIFQMTSEDAKPLPVRHYEKEGEYFIYMADYVICMSSTTGKNQDSFSLSISGNNKWKVLLTDLSPGEWTVSSSDKKVEFNRKVSANQNTIFFEASPGEYQICPVRD
ncbi:hypothetical protein [Sunxiuqinia elliptica]|uniref:Heparin/heparan-sulfate lyase n=1 Tax=Sunxiuqinia elliptica TaxID=655355 RepID=A0A4R6HAZ7_9BACT|nr:hypothetical protein [Sunxiuqinia elliptica]TDO05540.1 heparin/heparan-sulfate lyase [Sunxiuqinia elliptica]TDO65084.1 heparin/heparan-sulfate lyase [Sunxiuqinia elliptica]